ncbi:hypothetical protein COO72_01290 [Bifidobacterium callitrichos]|nr:hypothetical protein COO72_01290 [Bifidobacterium callitrichos]
MVSIVAFDHSRYTMLAYDELPADEVAMLQADAEEAERGYTDRQVEEAVRAGTVCSTSLTESNILRRAFIDDDLITSQTRFAGRLP